MAKRDQDDDDRDDQDDADDADDDADDDDDEPVTRGEVKEIITEALAPVLALVNGAPPTAGGGDQNGGVGDSGADDTRLGPRDLEAMAKRAAQEAVAILEAKTSKKPRKAAAKKVATPEVTPEPPTRGRFRAKIWGNA